MREKRDLYERLLTQDKDVPNVEHDGIRYLMDAFIPDGLVICSFKFASDSMKMRENQVCSMDRYDKLLAVARAAPRGCTCGISIGDPRISDHSTSCKELMEAQEALNER